MTVGRAIMNVFAFVASQLEAIEETRLGGRGGWFV